MYSSASVIDCLASIYVDVVIAKLSLTWQYVCFGQRLDRPTNNRHIVVSESTCVLYVYERHDFSVVALRLYESCTVVLINVQESKMS